MNIIQTIKKSFTTYIQSTFNVDITAKRGAFDINTDENKQEFGDINSNIALIAAKQVKKNPREVAQQIINEFNHPAIEKIEIAGPGFINIFLSQDAFSSLLRDLHEQKEAFFKPEKLTITHTNIEFVSANPTGPLHFGHGRGGIIGDVLGNILTFLGHKVTKEFYINDEGNQIDKLGQSFKIRCLQISGTDAKIPEDGYHGEYLIELAHQAQSEFGAQLLEKDDNFFAEYAKKEMLENIQNTLKEYGISFDTYFSEKTLHENGNVETALEQLKQNNFLYKHDGAWWFKATQFGDDKDRVVKRASGEVTYIAADIAYLQNKINRGHNKLLMILGHDHHSYVTRLHAIQQALQLESFPLDVILYQLVKITKEGQLVRMSKRAGAMTTLQDIINTVGKDVARFFYLHRKAEAQLEFDLELALKKTDENPVYYVQYAYVRTGSVLQKANKIKSLQLITQKDAQYIGPEEQLLLKKIFSLKLLLCEISTNYHTHALTYFVLELSTLFHHYYAHNKVIDQNNIEKSRARLLAINILRETIGTILDLLGISKPKQM